MLSDAKVAVVGWLFNKYTKMDPHKKSFDLKQIIFFFEVSEGTICHMVDVLRVFAPKDDRLRLNYCEITNFYKQFMLTIRLDLTST